MKTVFAHIEHIKGKPHHVRRQIAFTAAAGGAGLIGLVWLVGSLSFGSFAIQGSSFADSAGQSPVITTDGVSGNQNLAGASAASQDKDAPAHIEIVDTTATAKSSGKQTERTTIPF